MWTEPAGKRVGIIGARTFPKLELVSQLFCMLPPSAVIVTGGEEGVEAQAAQEARAAGMDVTAVAVTRTEWVRLGRAAGPRRNAQLLESIDVLFVFDVPGTRYTAAVLELARRRRTPFRTFGPDSTPGELGRAATELIWAPRKAGSNPGVE